jgi:hypothetical protein
MLEYYSTFDTFLSVLMCPEVFNRYLALTGNPGLTCVPMSRAFVDSIEYYYGPGPCGVRSTPFLYLLGHA